MIDLFICSGEPSGDLHGAKLIEELLRIKPHLKIAAIPGPHMRQFPIQEIFPMESLRTMGFFDLLPALPRIIYLFFQLRNTILKLQPKAVVFIDYPGFHLRMQKSLKKRGFQGKLIHFICPTVWAWGKQRIPYMAKYLDLLLCIFPFEPKCFAHTSLNAKYVGHPLTKSTFQHIPSRAFSGKILSIFPGSRKKEIERNLPIQLAVAKKLQKLDPSLQIFVCKEGEETIKGALSVPFKDNYDLMRASFLSIATSGTIALELTLHQIPTVVCYAITSKDLFLAQKIFKINLPFYAIPNIILEREVFPELFGPNLTEENLFSRAKNFLLHEDLRKKCIEKCEQVRALLGEEAASQKAAEEIFSSVDLL